MSSSRILSDAMRQIIGRVVSAGLGIVVMMMISQYLGPYRYGDYGNIIDVFAIWGALADFGLYTLTLRTLGPFKEAGDTQALQRGYSKFLFTRIVSIVIVYTIVMIIAYQIPAYTANPYLVWGLPIGALFSAIFMASSMIQLPLQLFRQMKKVTIALTWARVSQLIVLAILIRRVAPGQGGSEMPLGIFITIMGSILISGLAQLIYTYRQASKHLQITLIPDRKFTRDTTRQNAAYGLAYFLSSMHTLATSIIMGILYPTIANNPQQGIRKLPLSIIVVLIIIPSSIGNSMIHKIANATQQAKRLAIGSLITLMTRVSGLIIGVCLAFGPQIIGLVGGSEYLSTPTQIGSEYLLPRLALILRGSFIKQSFNYLFLSIGRQNILLTINGVGILLGLPFAIYATKERGLIGTLWGQGILELLFIIGSLWAAHRYRALPLLPKTTRRMIIYSLCVMIVAGAIYFLYPNHHRTRSIVAGITMSAGYILLSYRDTKLTTQYLGADN